MWNEEESYNGYNEEEFAPSPADTDNIPAEEEYYAESINEEQLDILNEQLEVRENEVLDSAMVRLDQAKLYKMLIEHDLFQDVDAHPFALKKVQTEIRQFIMNRLEILLGMKKEQKSQPAQALPFSDLEVQALKDIAAKLTKGATTKTAPTPLKQPAAQAKSGTLSPVGGSPSTTRLSKPAAPQAKPVSKPAPALKKPVTKPPVVAEEPEIPEHLRKSPYEMTQEELLERAKLSKARKQVKNPEAKPMPNPDELAAITANKAMSSSVNNPFAGLLANMGAVPMANVGGKDDMY